MSAGHHITHRHSDALERELTRLMADPRVQKLLKRPRRVDFSYEMPLTGGSSVTWGTFYLDPKLKNAKPAIRRGVLLHEVVEKALRMVFGMGYDRAHQLATVAERRAIENFGMGWGPYKRFMRSLVRTDEHERPNRMPKDYDYGPLQASRGIKSLKGLKA